MYQWLAVRAKTLSWALERATEHCSQAQTLEGGSERTMQDWFSPVAPATVVRAQVLQVEGSLITMQSRNTIEATEECRIKASEVSSSERWFQSRLGEMSRAKRTGNNDLDEVFI